MGEVLISVEGLWKKYPRSLDAAQRYALRDGVGELLGRRQGAALRDEEAWVLRDVSLDVRRGECLGVIGPNGAGKTTLLKAIAGQIRPDRGTVTTHGRVDRLIAAGGGFDPLLSGRENVRLRATLLGIAGRDFGALLDEVVAFAELEETIDSPVQFYSAGMQARLGFAVSTMVAPDVLLLDEVLAVGDLAFRLKCYDRIFDLMARAAVVFVSHSMAHVVRVCSAACLLERGAIAWLGEVDRAIDAYHRAVVAGGGPQRHVARDAHLIPVTVDVDGAPLAGDAAEIPYGARLRVVFDTRHLPAGALFRVVLREAGERLLVDWSSARSPEGRADGGRLACDLGPIELKPGRYTLIVSALDADSRKVLAHDEPLSFQVAGAFLNGVPVQKAGGWRRLAPGEG